MKAASSGRATALAVLVCVSSAAAADLAAAPPAEPAAPAAPSAAPAPGGLPTRPALPTPTPAAATPTPAATTGAALTTGAAAGEDPQRLTAHGVDIFLKVARPEEAQAAIMARLDAEQGIALLRSQARLELKVPPAGLEGLIATIEAQGLVMDKARQRDDRTLEIGRLRVQLEGRRALMERMRGFLEQADASETGQIEWRLLQLLTETEQLAGQLRAARDRVRYARVTVALQWQSSAPLRYQRAPFPWLDTTGIDQVLSSFGNDGGSR